MKTGSIASNLVALSLGAFFTACGGAEMNDGSQLSGDDVAQDEVVSSFASVEQDATACDDNQYDHWRYMAGLAVAAGTELGRWNGAKDFVKENTNTNARILLSSEGAARCAATGCVNVNAMLKMQDVDGSQVARHDPLLLRQYLVTYFDRQKGIASPAHTLTLAGTTPDACGLRYYFNVGGGTTTTTTTGISGSSELKPTSAYKCVDIVGVSGNDGAQVQQYSCNGASNQKFTIEANGSNYRLKANNSGKCLGVVNSATNDGALLEQRSCGANNSQNFSLTSKGNGAFEIKNVSSGKCLDIQGGGTADGQKAQLYTCHGGANQTIQATGFTSGTTTTTTTSSVNTAALKDQLKFAGDVDNRYLAFQSTSSQVSIDPNAGLNPGDPNAESGSCLVVNGPTAFSATASTGGCCIKSTSYGTLLALTSNPKMFKCIL